jgi:hypothetical protein
VREPADLVPEGAVGTVVAVERTVPRERVFLAQTPQAFRTEVLAAAIAAGQGLAAATDEAALAEAAGFPVRIVTGDTTNLKITTMTDLTVAQALSGRPQSASAVRVVIGGITMRFLISMRPMCVGSNSFRNCDAPFKCAPPSTTDRTLASKGSRSASLLELAVRIILYMLTGPVFQRMSAQSTLRRWPNEWSCDPEAGAAKRHG